MRLSFFILALLVSLCRADLTAFLQIPRHDGIKRVCHLNAENFTSSMGTAETAVVIFKGVSAAQRSTCPSELDSFAEVTAQILRKKNVLICEMHVDDYPVQTMTDVRPKLGDVYVYKSGRKYTYYGKKSAPALLSFLQKLNTTQLRVITGKMEKIAFDNVHQPKVVGYFMPGSPDQRTFEEVSAIFSPSVPFYAVYDAVVARHLKMNMIGQIYMFRPFEKFPLTCPINPVTSRDLESFVNMNKGVVLTHLTEHNLHDPKLLDPNRILILAIGEQSNPLGGYFHHLLGKLVRNTTGNMAFQQLNILWIEARVFPTVHIMMDFLESNYGIPSSLPALGTINSTNQLSAWFNMAMLNTSGDRFADEQNIQIIMSWLASVINRTVPSVHMGGQSFVEVLTSQEVVEGSDAVFPCVIENPVGDCLWIKDGQNLGFTLSGYPDYSWKGDVQAGDCTLLITGVQKNRDEGKWACQMTGNANSSAITSPTATITIVGALPSFTGQTPGKMEL